MEQLNYWQLLVRVKVTKTLHTHDKNKLSLKLYLWYTLYLVEHLRKFWLDCRTYYTSELSKPVIGGISVYQIFEYKRSHLLSPNRIKTIAKNT